MVVNHPLRLSVAIGATICVTCVVAYLWLPGAALTREAESVRAKILSEIRAAQAAERELSLSWSYRPAEFSTRVLSDREVTSLLTFLTSASARVIVMPPDDGLRHWSREPSEGHVESSNGVLLRFGYGGAYIARAGSERDYVLFKPADQTSGPIRSGDLVLHLFDLKTDTRQTE